MASIMWTKWLLVTVTALAYSMAFTEAAVGVNWGMKGDNLPPPQMVVNFLKNKSIPMVRLFDPNQDALNALRGSGIQVSLGSLNSDIHTIAGSTQAATDWLNANVVPYNDVDIKWITIGNEVIPGDFANSVLPAMQNMQTAVQATGLSCQVTTVVSMAVLGTSFPPSTGAFSSDVLGIMTSIVSFLNQNGSPLMVNVYPYFSFASNTAQINLDYALSNSGAPSVTDQGLVYNNLFDATLDSVLAAVVKAGGSNDFKLIVSESGWPSAGNEPYTSVNNAMTYNTNLKNQVSSNGTPMRPSQLVDVFIFALFNENQKPGTVEQNFGNLFPNMSPVYPMW